MDDIITVIIVIGVLYFIYRYLMAVVESANQYRFDYRHPKTREKDRKDYQTVALVFFIIFAVGLIALLAS